MAIYSNEEDPNIMQWEKEESIKNVNLNMLFADLVISYAHLATFEKQTKQEFIDNVKESYSMDNQRNSLFVASIEKSVFNTIRLSDSRATLLFNE